MSPLARWIPLRLWPGLFLAFVAALVIGAGVASAWRVESGPTGVLQQPSWPATWSSIGTDPDENGCNDHRNVIEAFYAEDADFIYLRLETVTDAGWPATDPQGEARYKWFFDFDGDGALQGGNIDNAEFQLILEDRATAPDPTLGRNQLGELTLMDDLLNVGFSTRWGGGSPPGYMNNGQASTLWRRALGTGTPGVGGPQGVETADIGYRIDGVNVDMYVSRDALGDPTILSLFWSTDNHDPNLDSSPNCDRPDAGFFVPVVTPTPTATSTATPSPTATATSTSTSSPTASATATPTATATATATPTPTPSPTATPTATPTPSPTATATATATPSPTATFTPASGPGVSPTPTSTEISAITEIPPATLTAVAGVMVGGEPLGELLPRSAPSRAAAARAPRRGGLGLAATIAALWLGIGALGLPRRR